MTVTVGCREIVRLAVCATGAVAAVLALAAPAAQATVAEGHPEFLVNGKLLGREPRPVNLFGNLELASPEESEGGTGNAIECATVVIATIYNATEPERNPTGLNGSGQILSWWGNSHMPREVHPELSSHCRFVEHGANLHTERAAWLIPEPRLREPRVEAEFCRSAGKKLSECPASSERETELLIKEVKREALPLPWEVELISTEAHLRSRIGAPSAEERAKGHKSCEEPLPAPRGCIKAQILVPELAVDESFEGNADPFMTNGILNGLSPSTWDFEGKGHEPCVRLTSNGEKCLYLKGVVKIIGFEGQELVTGR
jgi:hypothetical protein